VGFATGGARPAFSLQSLFVLADLPDGDPYHLRPGPKLGAGGYFSSLYFSIIAPISRGLLLLRRLAFITFFFFGILYYRESSRSGRKFLIKIP